MSTFPAKLPLSRASAVRLLDLLCEDDAFRSQFQRDPSGALSAQSLQQSSGVRCAPLTSLASKSDFQAARLILQQQITQTGMFTVPHYFETGCSSVGATKGVAA